MLALSMSYSRHEKVDLFKGIKNLQYSMFRHVPKVNAMVENQCNGKNYHEHYKNLNIIKN